VDELGGRGRREREEREEGESVWPVQPVGKCSRSPVTPSLLHSLAKKNDFPSILFQHHTTVHYEKWPSFFFFWSYRPIHHRTAPTASSNRRIVEPTPLRNEGLKRSRRATAGSECWCRPSCVSVCECVRQCVGGEGVVPLPTPTVCSLSELSLDKGREEKRSCR
jgi:hypothetical protein